MDGRSIQGAQSPGCDHETVNELLSNFEGKQILVTGGAGCIGSNLVSVLLDSDAQQIVVLDDLSSSYEWNIPASPNVRFVKGSIIDDESLKTAFSEPPSFVFHLAAHFANQNSIVHPEIDLLVNGQGTLKALEYSRKANVSRFIFASSGCSVYGSKAPLPLTEDYVSLHLDTPYQITKLLGELYCNFYRDYYNLPIVTCRFFNVYGPGEVPGKYRNVIPNFIYWALQNRALPITGTGDETRDWTYVSDIVDGILRCATSPKAVGEAINLASGIETRVSEVARMVNLVTGNTSGMTKLPKRDWDKIDRRRASIDKASRLIGYRPKVKLQDGIEKTMKWITAQRIRIDQAARF